MTNLAAMDLNLLLVLHTVLGERSVARAARRLHVTPSAVSNSLARLRAALGDPLLARSGRGIVPTPRAAELAPALARALQGLDEALHGAAFDPATTVRTFTLAIADAGQVVRVPLVATRLASRMPRAQLRVVGIDSLISLGGLAGTEIDAAIGPGERGPGIHHTPLWEEQVVLVARRGHPTVGARLARSALASLRHVAIEMAPGRWLRDLAGQAYARADLPRTVAVRVPTFTTALAIVAQTDLVASVPVSLHAAVGVPLGLRVVAAPVPMPPITMHLSWHERTHGDPPMVYFRELVRDATAASASSASRRPSRSRRRPSRSS